MKSHTTVLIPPLLAPSAVMLPLAARLRRSGHGGPIFSYPSYREDLPANGRRLARFLRNLRVESFDAVTFSMGGIVLRWAMGEGKLPGLRRAVLIAAPNRGAEMASLADRVGGPLFPLLCGKCARQLRPGDAGLCETAPLLPESTSFAVIAGGRGSSRGVNPFLKGDNDRVVRVEETQLVGMSDFALVRAAHGPLIFRRDVAEMAVRFLKTGALREEGVGPLPDYNLPRSA